MNPKEEVKNFNRYVHEKARELLDEIKRNIQNYGQARTELRKFETSFNWSADKSYLMIIEKAKNLLENEINAITF